MKPVKRTSPFRVFNMEPRGATNRHAGFAEPTSLLLGNQMTTDEILRVFERAKPVETISEYEKEQQAIRSNFERLKQERINRQAAASKETPQHFYPQTTRTENNMTLPLSADEQSALSKLMNILKPLRDFADGLEITLTLLLIDTLLLAASHPDKGVEDFA
jgi:hypothetical protein